MDQKVTITPEMANITDSTDCCDINDEILSKLRSLHNLLDTNLIECDIKWSLFVMAAQSPYFDALLKPFPPGFGSRETGYKMDALLAVIADTPPLSVFLEKGIAKMSHDLSRDVIELLHWVLISAECAKLVLSDEAEAERIKFDATMPKPTHVFKFDCEVYGTRMKSEDCQISPVYGTVRLDHVFSILNQGFKEQQYNLSDVMKVPVMLRTSRSVTLEQNPLCSLWKESSCGSLINCVVLANYVFNPQLTIFRHLNRDTNQWSLDLLISDGQLVRLRYLLLYSCPVGNHSGPSSKNVHTSKRDEPINPVVDWIVRHKLQISLAIACTCILLL